MVQNLLPHVFKNNLFEKLNLLNLSPYFKKVHTEIHQQIDFPRCVRPSQMLDIILENKARQW